MTSQKSASFIRRAILPSVTLLLALSSASDNFKLTTHAQQTQTTYYTFQRLAHKRHDDAALGAQHVSPDPFIVDNRFPVRPRHKTG